MALSIAGIGLELSKALYTFAETVRGAEKFLEHLASEVTHTSTFLEQLGSSLEKCKKHGLASDSAIMAVKSGARMCSEDFNKINATLEKARAGSEKYGLKKPFFILVRWPRLQKKMERQRSDLEKHKTNLMLELEKMNFNLLLQLQYEAPLSYGDALAEYILQQAKFAFISEIDREKSES